MPMLCHCSRKNIFKKTKKKKKTEVAAAFATSNKGSHISLTSVASTINMVTVVNYTTRGVIYDCSGVPIL
jgi:hypothetical protein